MGIVINGFSGRSAMSDAERSYIINYLRDYKNNEHLFIEIGTLDGVSVGQFAVLNPHKRFLSVDPFIAAKGTGPGRPEVWKKNQKQNMTLFVGTFQQLIKNSRVSPFAVLVDGDHSYIGCMKDLDTCLEVALNLDTIFVHDYGRTNNHLLLEVTQSVDDWLKKNTEWKLLKTVDTLAVLTKNKD